MKKLICLLLTLSLVFAFAACQKKGGKTDDETTTDNYQPGAWVTDASGVVQTTVVVMPATDKDGEFATVVATKEDGQTYYDSATTYVYSIQTYPAREGETLPTEAPPQTSPVGNTLPSQNKAWPSDKFMAALPKAADKVDYLSTTTTEEGHCVSINVNDYSYEQFLKYTKTLAAAGFTQSYGNPEFPEKAKDGSSYYYGTIANGLYVTVCFNTDSAPYRNCDLNISVADYDVGGIHGILNGQNKTTEG
ncbi:MAG: hypothetical protein IJU96_10040 [Clostridia bacterium]|nr:hypothetical protein [Clostridia bacterium]